MTTFKLLAVLLVSATMLACESTTTTTTGNSAGAVAASAMPVTVLRQSMGNDPALIFPAVMLIQSQAELDALKGRELAAGKVDFSKESLVVIALGEQATGGYWAKVTAVQAAGSQLFVQGIANRPGKDEVTTQAKTYPFAAAVIAKTSATSVRSDVQSVVGQKKP